MAKNDHKKTIRTGDKIDSLQKKLDDLSRKLKEKDKELQIEAALERVRARSMAMHKSDELAEVASVGFQQLAALGILQDTQIFGFGIIDEDTGINTMWATELGGKISPSSMAIPVSYTHLTLPTKRIV